MSYCSTRGGVASVDFADAVRMGLATDGGLLVPEALPSVTPQTLGEWRRLRFQDLALEVMAPFVGDALPRADLVELIDRSYATFAHPEVTPVVEVGDTSILELFHGPTAAFKDVALQFLGNLFEYLLARDGGQLNIVGATSGDTGSAAIAGVRGKDRIQIFILHPQGRISPIQERQMTTVLDANVHNVALRGTFDDGQRLVKALFNDLSFKERYQLGAVNSINWARILAQMVYYFYAWGRVADRLRGRPVTFAVPTGNFGDIFAGYLAKRMGLPIERLILATNRNDILTRFVASGAYATGEVYATLSPAMDIQIASNFERYLYYLVGEDPQRVRALLDEMGRTGRLRVTGEEHAQVQRDFTAVAVDDAATLAQIRETYETTGYILDPHTAVGVRAGAGQADLVCLATAHPAKFNEAVREAIGCAAPAPASLRGLMDKPTRCVVLDADIAAVRDYIGEALAARP
ncbi:threonine synthase [Thioflavicoccus mobilis 8321]|uniref:Threonine synthase n=1 Tax=Thioflavicoccus mobilis 8321 TaxID=765912 RepID=L0GTL3_9GAMM|nr:threonine synthase [Thioflavicoccus mobilis]AGA90093.1 threonine synthase [Thioflavicoccus mobilis 8321]